MDFTAPSPPSSSSSDADYLSLEPSDPLNLLLNNAASDFTTESTPDWSQLSHLWPHLDGSVVDQNDGFKYPDVGMDFTFDMDFDSAMSINPNDLHFPTSKPQLDLLSPPFPFTFQPTQPENFSQRRLSVTSSSSSSGASLSPVVEHAAPIEQAAIEPKYEDAADMIAQRVRESAGVMLAVPSGTLGQQQLFPAPQAKLPIPRLAPKAVKSKRALPTKSGESSAASTPPPSDSGSTPSAAPTPAVRPKTSHTTIERRYRTNLNVRIQSLRQAVPALRVLEDKAKENDDGSAGSKEHVDVVDERGFVDGVKVARKCSKANVLGKAVEYIRVLKKRENRLTREQNGLKSLLCGLVGGPALLREWEQEWRSKFGGAETDEVEGEEMDPMSDDEDDEGDDEDDDEGRKRKKPKVSVAKPPAVKKVKKPPPPPMPDANGVVPEKRKRGRPRKVIPPPEAPPAPVVSTPAAPVQQYLLATFALFSFFNSPLTSTSTTPTHHGTVLGHSNSSDFVSTTVYSTGTGWRELVQVFHLLVSALVFLSIVLPWVPYSVRPARIISSLSAFMPSTASTTPSKSTQARPVLLAEALALEGIPHAAEAEALRVALGLEAGVVGFMRDWLRGKPGGRGKEAGFELRGLEQRAWVRLGEIAALDPTTSVLTLLLTYWRVSSHIAWFTASSADLSALALLMQPLSRTRARSLWTRARARALRPYEAFVLSTFTADTAVARLRSLPAPGARWRPLAVLAATLIRERALQHATHLFISAAAPEASCTASDSTAEAAEARRTAEAARSLGGRIAALGELLDRVRVGAAVPGVDADEDTDDGADDAGAVLRAVVLYRAVCGGAHEHALELRRALGAVVFDAGVGGELGGALEDARDRAVDMLVGLERGKRGGA